MRKFYSLLLVFVFMAGVNVNAQFAPDAEKVYFIKNVTHDKYLDSNGTQAILADKDESLLSQRFMFEAMTGDYAGAYKVKQVSSQNYLRRSGGANFNNDTQGQAYIQPEDKWTDNFPVVFEDATAGGQYYMGSKYNGTAATNTDRYFFFQETRGWVRSWCTIDNADIWAIEEAPASIEPTELQNAVQAADDFLATIDPQTDVQADEEAELAPGQYTYATYTALQTALTDALTYLAETTTFLPADVAAKSVVVNNALSAFRNSQYYPMVSDTDEDPFRLESGEYYIKVGDYYLTAPDEIIASGRRKDVYLATKNPGNLKDNQVWSVQYNQTYTDPHRYTFVSCVSGSTWTTDTEDGLGSINEKGEFAAGNTTEAQSDANKEWRNFSVYYNGSAYCFWILKYQSAGGQRSVNVTPVFDGENNLTGTTINFSTTEKSYLYTFEPYTGSSVSVENSAAGGSVSVTGSKGEINIIGAEMKDTIEIYNLSGVLVKAVPAATETIPMERGMYLVKISGATNTVSKVIVQ